MIALQKLKESKGFLLYVSHNPLYDMIKISHGFKVEVKPRMINNFFSLTDLDIYLFFILQPVPATAESARIMP